MILFICRRSVGFFSFLFLRDAKWLRNSGMYVQRIEESEINKIIPTEI